MSDLYPGDTVEVGATHEVKIDRLSAWIKVGVTTTVQSHETGEDAIKRASKVVAHNVITEMERQGEVVAEANAAQR